MREAKGCLTLCSVRRMGEKIEKTGLFIVLGRRRRKSLPLPIQKEMFTGILELCGLPNAFRSARGVSREFNTLCDTFPENLYYIPENPEKCKPVLSV